ncbi:hypothetical protein PO124_22115 [Bacillus licheniformis]|nr:hypothetical protein [Bacillus licheniformis]
MASDYGIRFIRFTPLDISPGSLLVKGLSFHPKSGQWNEIEREIPELIYDRCFTAEISNRKSKPIVEWLKSILNDILGLGLPDKWTVYKALKADPVIKSYLPATTIAEMPRISCASLQKKIMHLEACIRIRSRGIIHLELTGKR